LPVVEFFSSELSRCRLRARRRPAGIRCSPDEPLLDIRLLAQAFLMALALTFGLGMSENGPDAVEAMSYLN